MAYNLFSMILWLPYAFISFERYEQVCAYGRSLIRADGV